MCRRIHCLLVVLLIGGFAAEGRAAVYDVNYATAVDCAGKLTAFASLIGMPGGDANLKRRVGERAQGFIDTAIAKGLEMGKSERTVRSEYSASARKSVQVVIRTTKRGSIDRIWPAARRCLDLSGGPGGG